VIAADVAYWHKVDVTIVLRGQLGEALGLTAAQRGERVGPGEIGSCGRVLVPIIHRSDSIQALSLFVALSGLSGKLMAPILRPTVPATQS
jgi:hypothetical protein